MPARRWPTAGLDWDERRPRSRVGVYVGVTEHGNVETENEIYEITQFNYDTKVWSHHHNPRTVANNPAGEITLNMGITGPHYTIGAACAAGNAGLIQGAQMLLLDECDLALAGGVSESIHTFGIFAGFASQGALAAHDDPAKASRPFDRDRNGIVVSEGGCLYTLERLQRRDAPRREDLRRAGRLRDEQRRHRLRAAQSRAAGASAWSWRSSGPGSTPSDIDIVSTHATATAQRRRRRSATALRAGVRRLATRRGSTTPRASSATRWAPPGRWSWPATCRRSTTASCHATINVDELDPECDLPGLVLNEPQEIGGVEYILNNSFGMLGINSAVIIKRV